MLKCIGDIVFYNDYFNSLRLWVELRVFTGSVCHCVESMPQACSFRLLRGGSSTGIGPTLKARTKREERFLKLFLSW